MSALVIGLTGGIGSGKTTISDHFQSLGVKIIDADVIARQVVAIGSPALNAIAEYFGDDYLLEDGQLNRAVLRSHIFSNEVDKKWLSELLHPLIRAEIVKQTSAAKSPYCVLVAPLLIENNLLMLVNRVLVVDISEETQLARTLQRDTSSEQEIKAIIASQTTRSTRRKHADDIINNDNLTLSEVKVIVSELNTKYLALTKMV
jgi:dephospho-CoA kinase